MCAYNIGYMKIHIEYIKISYGCESDKNNLFKKGQMTKPLGWVKHVFSALHFIFIEDLFVILVKY